MIQPSVLNYGTDEGFLSHRRTLQFSGRLQSVVKAFGFDFLKQKIEIGVERVVNYGFKLCYKFNVF